MNASMLMFKRLTYLDSCLRSMTENIFHFIDQNIAPAIKGRHQKNGQDWGKTGKKSQGGSWLKNPGRRPILPHEWKYSQISIG